MKKAMITLLAIFQFVTVQSQEKQVSLDLEGKIITLNASTERKLKLFTEYRGFQDARLWQTSDTTYVLEILYQPEGSQMRARLPYNQWEVEQLRQRVSSGISTSAPDLLLNQEGRTLFLINSTAVSLMYYGPTTPVMLNIEDGRGFIGTYMLMAGSGFFISRAATRNINMPYGSSLMAMYGQTRGILLGAMIPFLFKEEASERAALLMGMAGSVGGVIGGYHYGQKKQLTSGTASTIGAMGDFGILFGIASMATITDDFNISGISASMLLGSAAGLYSGRVLSGNTPYTWGDAMVLRTTGYLGAYSMMSLVSLFEPDNYRVYPLSMIIGGIGGIALGHNMAGRYNYNVAQGIQTVLGSVAGLLVGFGTGYLVSSDSPNSYKTINLVSTLGGWGGFLIMSRIFSDHSRIEKDNISMNVSINPLALNRNLSRFAGDISHGNQAMPLVTASFRF